MMCPVGGIALGLVCVCTVMASVLAILAPSNTWSARLTWMLRSGRLLASWGVVLIAGAGLT